jgi:ATP-binding cassette subfamily G (WHITE) protein 2
MIGYECEEHNNPPDFFLDVINGDSTAVQQMQINKEKNFTDDSYQGNGELTNHNFNNGHDNSMAVVEMKAVDGIVEKSLADTLADAYQESQWFKRNEQELTPLLALYEERKKNGTELELERGEYSNTFATQLKYVAKRTILNVVRNPQTTVLQLMVMLIFGVVVGLIFLRIGDTFDAGIQNRIGVLFFVTVNQMFSNLSAVELFIKERTIFLHECSSGFYRVSAYFFAKVFCDILPMRIVPLSVFTVITYFMVGLQQNVAKFFIYWFVLLLTTLCASAIGFVISASVRVFAIANLLVSVCYVLMMIFGGLLVNVGKMGHWLSWLQYLSIVRYSLNALSINELNDLTFHYYNETGGVIGANSTAGPDYLTGQGIKHSNAWDLWQNMMALIIIFIGMMSLAYIQLRRLKLNK